jgi:multimeric flavodoxin WrbA
MGIAVLFGSSRRNGNTDILGNLLVEGLEADKIYLADYNLQPITDYRQAETKAYPDDDYHNLIARVLQQDVIVFVTPIYWYGISGILKTFIDRWSQTLLEDRSNFLGKMSTKKAYVLAVGDDEPLIKGLPLIHQFQYIFAFTRTQLDGYVIGTANKPGAILQDNTALTGIEQLRVKLSP